MSSLARQKVEVCDDPLMNLINRPSEDERSSSVDQGPSADIAKVASMEPTKSEPLFNKNVFNEPSMVSTTATLTDETVKRTPAKAISTMTSDDILTPSSVVTDNDDDVFKSVPTTVKAQQSPKSGATANLTPPKKIDLNKEDDEIGDLQVAQLLEKEDKLDYDLFGKVESTRDKKVVQQKKPMMEIDAETDFLRQLDELTAKASSVTPNTSSSKGNETQISTSTVTMSASVKDLDLSSIDLNAYIAQESHSGGGLFDD